MRYSKEEINKIIGLKGVDGKPIDVFRLHGILFVGNSESGTWDLTRTYVRFSEHSLGISINDFDWCESEENVSNQFHESLEEAIKERLV